MKRNSHFCSMILLLGLVIGIRPLQAADAVVGTGTVASCTEAAFNAALATVQASSSGTITFNCGGAATITFTSGKIITKAVTINGGGNITLHGGNVVRHFYVDTPAALTLQNITLGNGYDNTYGGGSILSLGALTLTNSTIRDSNVSSTYSGGAIMSLGPVTMSSSLIENNTGGSVGGLYLFGENADATVTNSTFRNNRTTNSTYGYGGAITVWDGADMTVQGSTLSENEARYGGAIYSETAASTVDIKQNSTISQNLAAVKGGGFYLVAGALYLTDVAVTGNSSSGDAGGIRLGVETTAVFTKVTINNNMAGDDAGGVHLAGGTLILDNVNVAGNAAEDRGGGLASDNGTLMATNSTFSNNSAINGGGINQFNPSADTTLSQVTISDNTAEFGGGIYQDQGTLVLSNSTFNNNAANSQDGGDGGGIYIEDGTTNIFESTFRDNSSNSSGGGIKIAGGTLNVVRSTFYVNRAGIGGGIDTASGPTVNLTNVTFSQNSATAAGGAVSLFNTQSNFNYITFFNNSATTGSNVDIYSGTTTWKNVILQTSSGSNCNLNSIAITSVGYNLASDASCTLTGVGDMQNSDAQLGVLKDNGGYTLTHLPKPGSPALDSGQCVATITEDQRQIGRPVNGTCDRGAVERTADDVDTLALFLPMIVK